MHHRLLLLALIINTAESDGVLVVNMIYQLIFLTGIVLINAEMNPCPPGEVTRPYTFTFNCTKSNDIVVLSKSGLMIALYSGSKCTIITDPDIYGDTCSDTTLTIKAVTTHSGGNYSCSTDGFNCNFRAYAKPNTVTCQDPEFQTDTNTVSVVGTVLRVFPHPVCQFTWLIDNIENHVIQKSLVEYNNLTGSGDPSYFNQRCSFKIPAQNFTSGKHQFQLLAYPDVTGQDNDTVYGENSNQTSPQYVADPSVTLVCSKTLMQEGEQFSCACNETANTFILPNTSLFYGATTVSSALQQVTATVTARRYTSELVCQAELPDGTKANKTHIVEVYFGPNISLVEANNSSGQLILKNNDGVSISCQAEGNPPPSLYLRKDGRELLQTSTDSTHKFSQTLTYRKAMADCMDTGVYTCHAEIGQAATNKTVTVYVKCAQQFRNHGSLSQRYKEQINGTVLIYVRIFGYPEPTVTLNSDKYILSSEYYTLNYIKQELPYGIVLLAIDINNASFFQNYSLNINNTEGALTFSFEIVEEVTPGSEKGDPSSLDVGAIVGGIVAAVLVIIIIFLIVCLVKRKGTPCREKTDDNVHNSMQTIYEIDESGSPHVLNELSDEQAPENPPYEEIVNFPSDVPDKAVYYANQISSNAREVDNENAVIGL